MDGLMNKEDEVCNLISKNQITRFKNDQRLVVGKEKAMAPHSSTLAWKIPWTEEPGAAVHGVMKSWT